MDVGTEANLDAQLKPENVSSNIEYTSTNKKVIDIDDYGHYVALSSGTATIMVKADDLVKSFTVKVVVPSSSTTSKKPATGSVANTNQTGTTKKQTSTTAVKKDTTKKNIVQPILVSDINLSGISKKIAAGKKIKLLASVFPENATYKSVVWTTSNKKVATVNQSGVVSVKKKTGGKSVIITAMAVDGSGIKAQWRIKSMKGVVKSVAVKGAKPTIQTGKTLKLKAVVKATKGANKKLKWISSNPAYATVNAKGVVKAMKVGKGKIVKITVMATDGSNKKKVLKLKIK